MRVINPDEDNTGLEPSEAAQQVRDLHCQLTLPAVHSYWREYLRLYREYHERHPRDGERKAHRIAMSRLLPIIKFWHRPDEQSKAEQAVQLLAGSRAINSRIKQEPQ